MSERWVAYFGRLGEASIALNKSLAHALNRIEGSAIGRQNLLVDVIWSELKSSRIVSKSVVSKGGREIYEIFFSSVHIFEYSCLQQR